eukprot:Phypoly_transcript_20424.p1 GENE.Phypoly_transcript_20424~~Phypoly_transcript_20424.p1  ORF type:complete len:156 (+),score=32.13 Phypoly_transcript_20424:193-660(+)
MVLPLIKVASLVIKSASKPFAKQIKKTAANNPRFQTVVVGCARAWHNAEGKMSIFVGDRIKEPKQLNVAAAVDLGSELASEGFLLGIAVVLLFLENKRSSNKDKKKEEQLQNKFIQLEDTIQKQKDAIDTLQAQVEILANQANSPPPVLAPGNKG